MNPELAKKMLDVISSQDEKAALALLVELAASMASGGEPPAGDPAAESEALAETPEPPAEDRPEDEQAAKLTRLEKFMADTTETLSKLISRLIERQEQAASKEELDERRGLVASLVKCGSETPATAWSGKPEDRKPAEPWASMPIAALRERVAKLSKGVLPKGSRPPEGSDNEPDALAQLSKDERAAAEKIKDPAQRARFVELRLSRKVNADG